MDVFSLVKFWRNAGIGDPLTSTNFDISDDESSFFDLVFTNNDQCVDSTSINIISDFHTNGHYQQQQGFSNLDGLDTKSKSKSNHTYYSCSSPHSIFFNNKSSKILPLDSSSSTTTKSPFRVLKLGFQNNNHKMKHESNNKYKNEIKCDTTSIKEVTISSLLKRDNSLRNKLKSEDHDHIQISSKRFSKQVVYKYLNIIKPSKRFNDKARLPENSPFPTSSPATTSIFSPRKYLGKSRSSSSAAVKPVPLPALRRDDSALQQQDGIQSAILHCKRSYSSPSQGCQVLSRSGSAPSHGARISVDEEKRSSI